MIGSIGQVGKNSGAGFLTRKNTCYLFALTTMILSGCASISPQLSTGTRNCQGDSNIVCTEQGAIRGVVEGDMLAFKGLAYAAPPVGPQRFRPPLPPAAWSGVRDGSRFGAICPQLAGANVVGEEDCLTLNVWRPRKASRELLPVMVFLIGGGNHSFSGQGSPGFGGVNYNGGQLVSKDVLADGGGERRR